MKMKPIIFSGPMVRAILDGNKTQTRRVVRDAHFCDDPFVVEGLYASDGCGTLVNARYNPGDILWVKETWQPHPEAGLSYPEGKIPWDAICYAADFSAEEYQDSKPWKPSIYMPRDAARIFLKVTSVRVERLQDISEEDAKAEGVTLKFGHTYREAFEELWESINGKKHPWKSNPWVWVYEFERCEGENK